MQHAYSGEDQGHCRWGRLCSLLVGGWHSCSKQNKVLSATGCDGGWCGQQWKLGIRCKLFPSACDHCRVGSHMWHNDVANKFTWWFPLGWIWWHVLSWMVWRCLKKMHRPSTPEGSHILMGPQSKGRLEFLGLHSFRSGRPSWNWPTLTMRSVAWPSGWNLKSVWY